MHSRVKAWPHPRTRLSGALLPAARAASGQAAAALPSRAINSRRLTSGMGSPSEPAVPAYRTLRLPWKRRQVLGVHLNLSEVGEMLGTLVLEKRLVLNV